MLDKETTLFIIGSPDPEARAIESILTENGYRFAMAMDRYTYKSELYRVHSHSAYKTKALAFPDKTILSSFSNYSTVVLVECGGEFILRIPRTTNIIKVDHHNAGDYGWNGGPDKFFECSSIGQVMNLLKIKPNKLQLLTAAGDHCLAAAYNGRCDCIDPQELLLHRLTLRAEHSIKEGTIQEKTVQLAEIMDNAISEIKNAKTININGEEFVDFTYRDTIPLLGEAASYLGSSIISCKFVRDINKYKYMIQSMNSEAIEFWMEIYSEKMKLENVYGAPKRGYAGGYRMTPIGS